MKKCMKLFSLCLCLCLALSATGAASAAEVSNYVRNGNTVDILDGRSIMPRGKDWPTEPKDLSTGAYKGEITYIGNSKGVYASYYFKCNSGGKIKVTATLTAMYPLPSNSKCVIEIYDAVTKALVDDYDPGYSSYNEKELSCTFSGLSTSKSYVVRFVNKTSATYDNDLSGSITVSHP